MQSVTNEKEGRGFYVLPFPATYPRRFLRRRGRQGGREDGRSFWSDMY